MNAVTKPALIALTLFSATATTAYSESWRLVTPFSHVSGIGSATLTPDKKWLFIGGDDGTVIVWNLPKRTIVTRVRASTKSIRDIAVSPDGKIVATITQDQLATVWDVDGWKKLFEAHYAPGERSILEGAISPDGRLLALYEDPRRVTLWSIGGKRQIGVSAAFKWRLRNISFSRDGKYVIGAEDTVGVHKWAVERLGAPIFSLPLTGVATTVVSDSENNAFYAMGISRQSQTLSIFDGDFSKQVSPMTTVSKWDAGTEAVAMTKTHTVAYGDFGCRISVSQFSNPTHEHRFHAAKGELGNKRTILISFLDENELLVVCGDGTVGVWRWRKEQLSKQLDSNFEFVRFSEPILRPKERALIVYSEQKVHLYDLETHRVDHFAGYKYAQLPTKPHLLILNEIPDASPARQQISIFDIASRQLVDQWEEKIYPAASIAIDPQGRWLLWATRYGGLFRMNLETRKVEFAYKMENTNGWVGCIKIHPDGKRFVICHQYGAWLYDLSRPEPISKLIQRPGYDDRTEDAVFDPQTKSIFVARSGRIERFAADDGSPLGILATFEDRWRMPPFEEVYSLALTEDGVLVAGAGRGEMRAWRRQDGQFVPIPLHSEEYEHVRSLSVADKWIVATGLGVTLLQVSPTKDGVNTVARLFFTKDEAWAVVTPDGRYDSNAFDRFSDFAWGRVPELRSPLPFDSFMYSNFAPRLLVRLFQGDLEAGVASREPALPGPEISEFEIKRSTKLPNAAHLKIGMKQTPGTNAQVVKLFMNGRLIREFHDLNARDGKLPAPKNTSGEQWSRELHVPLPDGPTGTVAQFSAYAFSSDTVKGPTTVRQFSYDAPVLGKRPRIWLIAVGVGQNELDDYTLTYAACAARRVLSSVGEALSHAHRDYSVVRIGLINSPGAADEACAPQFVEAPPTRNNILAVLAALGGDRASRRLRELPDAVARLLDSARPDDVIVLYINSHGLYQNGQYNLVPSDASSSGSSVPFNTVSDQDLFEALRAINAGNLILMLDTCYSAGAVSQQGFKPGPFSTPGLAQLIYDKKFAVLVAANSTEMVEAFGTTKILDALVTRALEAGQVIPKGGSASFREVFDFVERTSRSTHAPNAPLSASPMFLRFSRDIVNAAGALKLSRP